MKNAITAIPIKIAPAPNKEDIGTTIGSPTFVGPCAPSTSALGGGGVVLGGGNVCVGGGGCEYAGGGCEYPEEACDPGGTSCCPCVRDFFGCTSGKAPVVRISPYPGSENASGGGGALYGIPSADADPWGCEAANAGPPGISMSTRGAPSPFGSGAGG